MIGREVNMERRREIHHYMLSIPISRYELAFGRVISGGIRGLVYMTPLLLTCFVFVGFPTIPQLLLIVFTLFMLAMGISGLSISIAVSTSSFEKFVTARGLVYYTFFFCSSVFYPLFLIQQLGESGQFPSILVAFAEVNPLSNASDMIRSFLMGTPAFSPYWILSVAIFALIFALTAAFAYIKILAR
jgi:ABC-2 type transport system permease protein